MTRPVPIPVQPSPFHIGYSSTFDGDVTHRWFRQCVIDAGRGAKTWASTS